MSENRFNPENKKIIDQMLLSIEGVYSKTMFGYPAYFINSKMFACLYQNGIGIKVSEEVAQELLKGEYFTPFPPMGRTKMKQWVQINRTTPQDYEKDPDIFLDAIQYILSR